MLRAPPPLFSLTPTGRTSEDQPAEEVQRGRQGRTQRDRHDHQRQWNRGGFSNVFSTIRILIQKRANIIENGKNEKE